LIAVPSSGSPHPITIYSEQPSHSAKSIITNLPALKTRRHPDHHSPSSPFEQAASACRRLIIYSALVDNSVCCLIRSTQPSFTAIVRIQRHHERS
jgi:hypothetical protein